MGCDIHLYVEYRKKGILATTTDSNESRWIKQWRSFGGRFGLERNYRMFEKLAGVRGDELNAITAPRGFPSDAGYSANEDNHRDISESGGDGCVSAADAARWVASGNSQYRGTGYAAVEPLNQELSTFETDGGTVVGLKAPYVTQPDWHSHSWLATEEYAAAIKAVAKPSESPEYFAVLAAMRQFDAAGFDSRVVFWFDN